MKKIFTLLSTLLLGASLLSAQAHTCGTASPTRAELDHIKQHIASINLPKNGGTTCVPIQAHVVRETNGTGGISLLDMNLGLSHLNEYYFEAGIEFYFCGSSPNYIDDSNFYDYQNGEENALATAAGENADAINMYFVDQIDFVAGQGITLGYAYQPSPLPQSLRIFLRNDAVASGLTIVHEMGHHYNLQHTFETANGAELVNGSNCGSAGDEICDTPADPGFNGTNVNLSCQYIGTATDANGDLYAPDITNAMSYFPEQCMDPFSLSPLQIDRVEDGLIYRQAPPFGQYSYSCAPVNVSNPSNFTATLAGTNANLSWTDNANNEAGYLIEFSTTSNSTGFRAFGGGATGPNTTSFSFTNGIQNGVWYYFRVKASNDDCNDYSNVDSVQIQSVCDAGDLNPTLINTSVDYCPNSTISLSTDGNESIPTGELYIWAFANATDTFFFNLGGATYTGDLNADLTANSLTPLAPGTYTVFGTVTDNGTLPACDETNGTFTLNVLQASDPACAAFACEAGEVAAALAGTTVDYCPGGSITLDTDGTEQIPTGGNYLWVFLNPGVDTFTIDVNGTSFTGDLNAALGANAIPTGTYSVFGVVNTSGAGFCDGTNTNFIINVLDASDPACAAGPCDAGEVAAALAGTTVDYCPGGSITLNTDGSEQIPNPGSYLWVFLNPGVDTFLIDVGGTSFNGDLNAALGANPIPAGTYTVFGAIDDTSAICSVTNTDFTINVLDANNPICTNPCAITNITPLVQSSCFPTSNTYTQSVTITYTNAPTSGDLNVNGQIFPITGSPQNVTLTALNADGNPVDVTAFFTNSTTCTFTASNAFTAPPVCGAVCVINSITLGNQSACDSASGTYDQEVIITYTDNPAGTMNVNGQIVAVTTSPQTVNLTGLAADGNPVDITAFFSSNNSCSLTETALYTAPSCGTPPPPCEAADVSAALNGTTVDYCPGTSITLETDGNEVIATGEEYLWVFINNTDTAILPLGPSFTGDVNALIVANNGTPIPPGTYTIFGVVTSGGQTAICDQTTNSFTINVLDANDPACNTPCEAADVSAALNGSTVDYCPGTSITIETDGNEIIASGEEYLWVFINNTDTAILPLGPSFTGDVNALIVANNGTPIPPGTYTVFGIVTSGGQTTICDQTPNVFTVNVLDANDPACAPPCAITAITSGLQSPCDVNTNTFTQEVTITYSNPVTGNINVNGQVFPVTTSPQTVTLTNLTANGNTVDVFAFFSSDPLCSLTETAAFTAPTACAVVPCAISGVSAGSQFNCDSSTNTYSQNVTITYSNAPNGTIEVNGQVFNQTNSPQTVTLNNLPVDGAPVDVTVSFTNDAACNFTANALFTAPSTCQSGGGTGVLDTLVVIMFPDGAGTVFVENDVITTTPFTGFYPANTVLDINVTVSGTNSFDFWKLNNLSLVDYSPATQFAFINQDTLFAYFNGALAISDFDEAFNSFNIYPTIVNDEVNVEMEVNENVNLSIELYSLDGKRIQGLMNEELNANSLYKRTFNLDISSGMYFLKISTDTQSISQKLIKY